MTRTGAPGASDAAKVPAQYKHVLKIEGGHFSVITYGGQAYDRAVRSFARAASQAAILGAGASAAVH